MSWGTLEDIVNKMAPSYSEEFLKAVDYAKKKGVILLIASGNSNTNSFFPADINEPNVITVSALDKRLMKASYSNWAKWVDVSAPGIVKSTVIGRGYAEKMGTSMATPVVGKVVILLKQISSDLTPDEIRRIIIESANPVDSNYAGYLGSGMVDAEKAVKCTYIYSRLLKPLYMAFQRKEKLSLEEIPEDLLGEVLKKKILNLFSDLISKNYNSQEKISILLLKIYGDNELINISSKIILESLDSNALYKGIEVVKPDLDLLTKWIEFLPPTKSASILNCLPFKEKVEIISRISVDKFLDIFSSLSNKEKLMSTLENKALEKVYAFKFMMGLKSDRPEFSFNFYLEKFSSSTLANIMEKLNPTEALNVLEQLNLIDLLNLLQNISMPCLDKILSLKGAKNLLSEKLLFPGDKTFKILTRFINHGSARVLGFLKNDVFTEIDPYFASLCLLNIDDFLTFRYMIGGVSGEVKLALLNSLLENGKEEIQKFFTKYDPQTYTLFIKSLLSPSGRCKGGACKKEETVPQAKIYPKVAKLLQNLDKDYCGKILKGLTPENITYLLPYLSDGYREAVLNSLSLSKYVKVIPKILEGKKKIIEGLKLNEERAKIINVYNAFFKKTISEEEMRKSADVLNSLPYIDSALIMSEILDFRKEKELDYEPLIELGGKVKEEILAEFLWFDDFWHTNFDIVTKILYLRGVDSTASIFNQAHPHAVAMVLKAEKLNPDFVADVFLNMDEAKVLDVVDDLLDAPFVGNEQDSIPYLSKVVEKLEDRNPELAQKITSFFGPNQTYDNLDIGICYVPQMSIEEATPYLLKF